MPYRASATCDDSLIAAREQLLAAAAQGRRRRELLLDRERRARARKAQQEKLAQQRAEAGQRRRERRAHALRMARGCSRLGLLAGMGWWGFYYGFIALSLMMLVPALVTGHLWLLWIAAAAAPLPVFTLAAVRLLLPALARRERRWARSLPFGLIGYPEALGHQIKKLRATLDFRRQAPSVELVRDLAAAHELLDASGLLGIQVDGRSATLTAPRGGIRTLLGSESYDHRRWVRQLAAMALQLHAVFPLQSVTLVPQDR